MSILSMMKKVLTIAGSDCSGGAGVQADIKTITAHKMYAMSVLTALTAQNTMGVFGVFEVPPSFVAQQIDCVFGDIIPDAVKIGMVSTAEIIHVIADKLIEYRAKNIVIDPVMFSTSGHALINNSAMNTLIDRLLPIGSVITPNIPEAESLCGFEIKSPDDMIKAAESISKMITGSVLIKGGHLLDCADDLLFADKKSVWFKGAKIHNPNTHGTGCTLSSAIACSLAGGFDLEQSVAQAKAYISGALSANLDLGKGRGPIDHCFAL